jgi:hypothetical protein
MTVNDSRIVGFEGYQLLLKSVHPDVVICVRGRHAIGKSEGVYQGAAKRRSDYYKDPENCRKMVQALADPTHGAIRHADGWVTEWDYEKGVPVVERRLSQMTEGDMIGLPYKNEVAGVDATQFLSCDWLIQSCIFPVMLFLDERNRALQGVKQAVFQLADSKAFYGNKLHAETSIVVAENVGEAYQVEQCDPAEISRWATVQLEPSTEEWVAYAENICHPATIEFVRSNPKFLEYTGIYEPNKKYPDRRSWIKLDAECQRLGLLDSDDPGMLLAILAGAMLGTETGNAFNKFVLERERDVKATDVLKNWEKAKKKLLKGGTVSNEKYVEVVHKIGDWLKAGGKLSENQAKNLAQFMFDCPPEPRMAGWANLQKDVDNLFMVHPHIEKLMVATATGEEMDGVEAQLEAARNVDSDSDEEEQETTTPTRGRKRR